jgi:hypothetical protein
VVAVGRLACQVREIGGIDNEFAPLLSGFAIGAICVRVRVDGDPLHSDSDSTDSMQMNALYRG